MGISTEKNIFELAAYKFNGPIDAKGFQKLYNNNYKQVFPNSGIWWR
jgi:hypothetical protein